MIFVHDTPTNRLLNMVLGGGSPVAEYTATGNPLTFFTNLSKPLKSLLIPFSPKQEGTGDPSPENIRSILPWNGLKVFGGGKNLLNPSVENSIPFQNANYNKYTLTDGVVVTSGNTLFGFKAKVKPNTVYRFTFDTTEAITMEIFAYTEEPTVIKNDDRQIININSSTWQFTTFSDTEWISCGIYTSKANVTVKDFRLTAGSTATAYEPYKPITETDIVFPSPVYGGEHEAVSGKMTVKRAGIIKKWKEGANTQVGASYTRKIFNFDVPVKGAAIYAYQRCNVAPQDWSTDAKTHFYIDENKAYLWLPNDTDGELEVQFVAVLVTPQEIQLTPAQITALVNDNTIWSDADGSMTAVYLKKG